MTATQIASDLDLATVLVEGSEYYLGAEFSQPIAMLDASLVSVSGVVQRIVGTGFQLAAVVEGSNDLTTWLTVGVVSSLLAVAPHTFVVLDPMDEPIAVASAYVRVKWVLYGDGDELKAGRRVLLSAHLNTGT